MDLDELEILLVANEIRLTKFKKASVPNLVSLNLTHTLSSHPPHDEVQTVSSDSSQYLMPTSKLPILVMIIKIFMVVMAEEEVGVTKAE